MIRALLLACAWCAAANLRNMAPCAEPWSQCGFGQPCCGDEMSCDRVAVGPSGALRQHCRPKCPPAGQPRHHCHKDADERAGAVVAARAAALGCGGLIVNARPKRCAVPLVFAIPTHIKDIIGRKIFELCLLSIRTHHPEAPVVVVDNASPKPEVVAAVVGAARLKNQSIEIMRVARESVWELGALREAVFGAETGGCVPDAYVLMQHESVVLGPVVVAGGSMPCPVTPLTVGSLGCWRGSIPHHCELMAVPCDHAAHNFSTPGGVVRPPCGGGMTHVQFAATAQGIRDLCATGLFKVNVTSKLMDQQSEMFTGIFASAAGSPTGWCDAAARDPGSAVSTNAVKKVLSGHLICPKFREARAAGNAAPPFVYRYGAHVVNVTEGDCARFDGLAPELMDPGP